jgi:hypothetical protein
LARQVIVQVICDKCGGQEDVQSWEIKKGSKKSKIDLCGTDSKALEEMFKLAPAKAVGGRTGGSTSTTGATRRTRSVKSVEDIPKTS